MTTDAPPLAEQQPLKGAELRAAIEAQMRKVAELRLKLRAMKEEEAKTAEATVAQAAARRALAPAELAQIRAVFDDIDADRSGFLDGPELATCAKQLGCKMTDDELKAAIEGLDTDKDGKVSFEEFTEWYRADSKLGGHRGGALAFMKAKLQVAKAHRRLTRAAPTTADAAGSSGRSHVLSFGVQTSEPFAPATTLNTTITKAPEGYHKAAVSDPAVLAAFKAAGKQLRPDGPLLVARIKGGAAAIAHLEGAMEGLKYVCAAVDPADPATAVLYVSLASKWALGDRAAAYVGTDDRPAALSIELAGGIADVVKGLHTTSPLAALFSEFRVVGSVNAGAGVAHQLLMKALAASRWTANIPRIVKVLPSFAFSGAGAEVRLRPLVPVLQRGMRRLAALTHTYLEKTLKKKSEEGEGAAEVEAVPEYFSSSAFADLLVRLTLATAGPLGLPPMLSLHDRDGPLMLWKMLHAARDSISTLDAITYTDSSVCLAATLTGLDFAALAAAYPLPAEADPVDDDHDEMLKADTALCAVALQIPEDVLAASPAIAKALRDDECPIAALLEAAEESTGLKSGNSNGGDDDEDEQAKRLRELQELVARMRMDSGHHFSGSDDGGAGSASSSAATSIRSSRTSSRSNSPASQ